MDKLYVCMCVYCIYIFLFVYFQGEQFYVVTNHTQIFISPIIHVVLFSLYSRKMYVYIFLDTLFISIHLLYIEKI